jgi:hypothetical protein
MGENEAGPGQIEAGPGHQRTKPGVLEQPEEICPSPPLNIRKGCHQVYHVMLLNKFFHFYIT